KDPLRNIDQQQFAPRAVIERPRPVELIVSAPDELVQVLYRVWRKVIGIGQRQVGAGRTIKRGESRNGCATRTADPAVLELPTKSIEILPLSTSLRQHVRRLHRSHLAAGGLNRWNVRRHDRRRDGCNGRRRYIRRNDKRA